MMKSGAGFWDARRSLAWVALAWSVLAALGGCASTGRDSAGTHDIVTESDEPESRRRARIRMELAIGYFEQGQTKVALDELKQVIVGGSHLPRCLQPAWVDLHEAERSAAGRGQLPARGGAQSARSERGAQLRLAVVPAGPL